MLQKLKKRASLIELKQQTKYIQCQLDITKDVMIIKKMKPTFSRRETVLFFSIWLRFFFLFLMLKQKKNTLQNTKLVRSFKRTFPCTFHKLIYTNINQMFKIQVRIWNENVIQSPFFRRIVSLSKKWWPHFFAYSFTRFQCHYSLQQLRFCPAVLP